MKVLYPITLDVKKTNVQKVIHANQGEGLDRKLVVTLVSGNDTIILDNENQSVQFVAKKPDGTTIYNATAIKDGKAILYLTTQTVAAVGDVDCQLEVVSTDEGSVGSGVIYSAKFTIAVEEALYSESTITSSNEFTELIELIERAEKQVTVFTGEGAPSDDPDEFDNIKESDFYYDSTNKTYRYAKSVTTTISWEVIIKGSELTNIVSDIYAALSDKANKTYVDTELAKKQNNLSAGNGVELNNDIVSAKVSSTVDNALNVSSSGLYLSAYELGFSTYLRQTLVNTSAQNALASRSYVEDVALGLGNALAVSINPTTYVMTLTLKHGNEVLSTGSVDLPLETMVVGAEYDSETKEIVLTLQSGSTVRFSVADLVSGLVTESDFQDAIQAIEDALADKQDTLTAGSNVTISNNTISATDTTYSAGANITIDSNNVISASSGSGRPITDTAKGSTILLTDSEYSPLDAISIMGKSTQNGTPTIDNPIPIVDITTEEVEITNGTDTQSAELTKTLRGIPVSSGGNYTDNNNQQWICDTIERYKDGSGKYIQRVGQVVYDGSESWTHESLSGGRNNFYTIIQLAKKGPAYKLYCNIAIHDGLLNDGKALVSASGNFNICINTFSDTTTFKNFISTNNLVVVYQLENIVETPLTSEELAELDLDTYYPSTTITANTDVVVEYVCDTKNYIDKKIGELS